MKTEFVEEKKETWLVFSSYFKACILQLRKRNSFKEIYFLKKYWGDNEVMVRKFLDVVSSLSTFDNILF